MMDKNYYTTQIYMHNCNRKKMHPIVLYAFRGIPLPQEKAQLAYLQKIYIETTVELDSKQTIHILEETKL